jgi:hypothetical protein
MRFVSVEYKLNGVDVKGYLQIPQDFPPAWSIGYQSYLEQEKKVKDGIHIYPLHQSYNPDITGKAPLGYTDVTDDFAEALASTEYYPECPYVDSLRRSWAKMGPRSTEKKIIKVNSKEK